MSHPTTHAKNASQHPGHILLEGKQQQCTSEQKQANDAEAERAWEEQEAAWECGIQRLVNIIDSSIQEEESQLTNPPKPKPRPCLIVKDPSQDSTDMTKSVFGDDDRAESDMTGMDLSGGSLIDSQGGGEQLVDGGEELDNKLEGSLNKAAQKQKCTQKASSHDAVLVVRGKLVGADEANRIADWHSMDSQKWKPDSSRYEVFPSLSMLTMMILLTETILFYWDCIDSSLEADKNKYSGVREVVNWADKLASSKPLHTLLSQHSASNSHYAWSVSSMGMGSQIRVQAPPTSACSSSHPPTPMINNPPEAGTHDDDSPYIQGSDTGEHLAISHPSAKTIHRRMNAMAITDIVSGSELDKSVQSPPPPSQYTCSQWGCSSSDAQKALRNEDDYVELSGNKIDDGGILLVEMKRGTKWDPCSQAKQGLSNWCAGFAAATVAVITTFFTHNVDFEDLMLHMKFANAMLKKNWFLFSQNRGTDNKTWTGLWQVLFILQTFTHHSNFIQGHADISTMYNDFSGPCMALTLASAAVYGADLVMSLFSARGCTVWTAILPKGGQFEFSEAVWGTMTRHYLEPIKELSDKQFGLIVEYTQKFMKKVTAPTVSTLESVGEDEFNNLFTFQ
ncbi:hypothetical protein EDD16DRAFT_1518038 [Pisolithus croceorrhizus]|nr:hypothetical protein EV401DRAFT_1896024 [Pisolithus croceorrhizus]KAI6123232.1 hypothetical protein EDD16DRAFT_1518038 [Pisolithus croceorrhizus]KAI6158879.1 hypothetical protein EDD17DRAFT_1511681 [Pisolithus thermaeus]